MMKLSLPGTFTKRTFLLNEHFSWFRNVSFLIEKLLNFTLLVAVFTHSRRFD